MRKTTIRRTTCAAGPIPLPTGQRPAQWPAQPQPPKVVRRAICCSGGGIRAAAFALGGLQRLDTTDTAGAGEQSYYQRAEFVTAVSGGSYTAAAYAVARNRRTAEDGDGDDATNEPVFALGSPEDARLRTHTRYLVEDRLALIGGILGILYGLVLNVIPLLAIAYLAAAATATALTYGAGVLSRAEVGHWHVTLSEPVLLIVIGLLGAAATTFVTMRMTDLYRHKPWSVPQLRFGVKITVAFLVAAAVVAATMIGVPALLGALDGFVARNGPRLIDGTQALSLGGTLSALSPVIAAFLRKVSKEAAVLDGNAAVRSLRTRLTTWIVPWLASLVLAAILLGAYLMWTSATAWRMTTDTRGEGWSRLWFEFWPAVVAALTLLLWHAATDLNRDSLHAFYADRLAFAFAGRDRADDAADLGGPMSALRPADDGPDLVLCATANVDRPGTVPTGRACAPMTFSPYRSGISAGTMFAGDTLDEREGGDPATRAWSTAHGPLTMPTARFEARADRKQLSVFDLVAVSGAALAPAMGRTNRPSVRFVLGVANVGLGMWLPNPMREPRREAPPTGGGRNARSFWRRVRWQLHQPGLRALFWELFGGKSLTSHWIYVTDGGHYENLGLVEALRRGANEVVVLDASGDHADTWTTLGEAIETARVDLGVLVDIDPSAMVDRKRGTKLAVTGRLLFPDGTSGTLYYTKLQAGSAVPWDVRARYRPDSRFPNDSTVDQLYDDREFEGYRALGWCAADEALALMADDDDPPPPGSGARPGPRSNHLLSHA